MKNNIYLIVTNDKITLDEKINDLLKLDSNTEVVYYDLLETQIQRLIEDLDTYNFFTNKKIVVGTNAYFLSGEKEKGQVEHNLDKLTSYLENPSSDNILILVVPSIDKRKKITSIVLDKSTLIEEITNIHDMIKRRLEDYKMSDSTEKLLLKYCRDDHERILNEIDKLKLYKLDEKMITEDDVRLLVMESLDDNIFHLIDSMLSGNKNYAFTLYHNFLLHGEQVVNIINILSKKIRLIYQVKVLLNDGNSDQAISKLLKVHEYSVKLAREASYKYNEKTLLDDLKKLALIDYKIKSGESTGEVEFETLLATI